MVHLLTKQEVARRLGLHPESVMRLVRQGQFPPPIKINPNQRGHVRFDPSDVERWLHLRKVDLQTESVTALNDPRH